MLLLMLWAGYLWVVLLMLRMTRKKYPKMWYTCMIESSIVGFQWRSSGGDEWSWIISSVWSERETRPIPYFAWTKANFHKEKVMAFEQRGYGVLRYHGRLCVPKVGELQQRIMEETHSYKFSIHPVSTKMYYDLRKVHWWSSMKRCIVEFIVKCLNSQQIKVEH